MTLPLPPGYEGRSLGSVNGFAWSEAVPWMVSVFEGTTSMHGWAATADGAERMSGRGAVYSVPAPAPGPDGRMRWAVRHYQRGGWLASGLGDRYLRTRHTRPLRELWASVEARSRGIRTPAVVAGAVYRAGAFYRADLVTGLVPGAVDLAETVFGASSPHHATKALAATGRLLRDLQDARVLHADLNAKNVLLVKEGEHLRAHVVDLDRCTILPLDSRPPPEAMRLRLERSLHKLGRERRQPLNESQWDALAAGFEAVR